MSNCGLPTFESPTFSFLGRFPVTPLPSRRRAEDSRFQEEFDQIKPLNKGAFGRVYEARKTMENKKYAVKCIQLDENNETIVQDSAREVEVLSAIKHRNIVFYYSAWWEDYPPSHWLGVDPDEENGDSSSENEETSFDPRRLEEMEQRFEHSSTTSNLDQSPLSYKRKSSDSNHDVSFLAETNGHKSHQDGRFFSTSQHATFPIQSSVNKTYLYIQTELCRQENLAHWLQNRLPRELKVNQMYRAILSAVNYLHSKDLVHRDLKPNNIFFDFDWSIKVGDFGLSKKMTTDAGFHSVSLNDRQSQADSFDSQLNHTLYVGTKPYMAPEQEKFQGYNHKVDVYALAIILFELKMDPFKSEHERAESISKLKCFHPVKNFKCNERLKELLHAMLSIDPVKRPEVKEILSEHFPKESKELSSQAAKSREASASARALIRHVPNAFHSKLLMLFLIRGIRLGYQFQLGADMFGMGGKFDNLIFKYRLNSSTAINSSWRYRFVQAKYKMNEALKITARHLVDKNAGDFCLAKYFRSYLHLRKGRDHDNYECIICTNIGFDINNLTKNGLQLVNVHLPDDILTFGNLNGRRKPACYQLQITEQLRQTFTTDWSDISLLAENLRRCARLKKPLALQHDVFKRYHVALINERVIDLETKKLHLDFISDVALSPGAAQLRQIVVKSMGKDEDLINWKFKLSTDFGKSSKKTVDCLPRMVAGEDIDGFFAKLVFAVELPNIAKLDHILAVEIGQHFKLLGPHMLQRVWELSYQTFLSSEEGQRILEENVQTMILFYSNALSIHYQDRLRKLYGQSKPKDLRHLTKELNRFVYGSTENNIHFLRLTTTCPKTTAVRVFCVLDSLRDLRKGDAYLTYVSSSKRFADTDEMKQWKSALEAGPYQVLVVVFKANVQFHEIYDKLISRGTWKKKVVIISKNQELIKLDSSQFNVPTASDGWKEIKDHLWPSFELECICMCLEHANPEAYRNIFNSLTEPSNKKIAVFFIQGKMNESFASLQKLVPQNYKIVGNQIECLNSEGFAAVVVHRSLDYQRILPSRISGNPRHIAGIQLFYNNSLLSLYSVYRSADSAEMIDPFFESASTCSKMVVCTSPLAVPASNAKNECKTLALPEGYGIQYGAGVYITNLKNLVFDSRNPCTRFSVL